MGAGAHKLVREGGGAREVEGGLMYRDDHFRHWAGKQDRFKERGLVQGHPRDSDDDAPRRYDRARRRGYIQLHDASDEVIEGYGQGHERGWILEVSRRQARAENAIAIFSPFQLDPLLAAFGYILPSSSAQPFAPSLCDHFSLLLCSTLARGICNHFALPYRSTLCS